MNTATYGRSLYYTANMNEQTERAHVWPCLYSVIGLERDVGNGSKYTVIIRILKNNYVATLC